VWGQTGSRPVAPKDLGFASAYLFGAVCPSQGKAEAQRGARNTIPAVNDRRLVWTTIGSSLRSQHCAKRPAGFLLFQSISDQARRKILSRHAVAHRRLVTLLSHLSRG
jgi:hypothetical protein